MTTSKMKDADMPLRDRIEAAIERIKTGQGQMRVPVEATDPDVVLADCLAELDAARARERHALVAGAEALRRIAAATPIGHEDVTKGPSTYTWLCYAASLLMAEAATTPATPLEQELITLRARAQRMREELAEIGAALNDPADNVTATTAQCITRLRAREAKIREALEQLVEPMSSRTVDTGIVRQKMLVVSGDDAMDRYQKARAALAEGVEDSPTTTQDTVVDGIDINAVVALYRGDRLAMAHALVQIRNAAGALREQLEQRTA